MLEPRSFNRKIYYSQKQMVCKFYDFSPKISWFLN